MTGPDDVRRAAGRERRTSTAARRAAAAATLLLLSPGEAAFAYPSAVVFAPTGRTARAGEISSFTLAAVPFERGPLQTYVGAQAGVEDGLRIGNASLFALEVGVDASIERAPGTPLVAPLFNAKVGLVDEHAHRPAVAIGVFQLSGVPSYDAALLYVAATSTLGPYGEATLGFVHSLAPKPPGRTPAFVGSVPFEDGREGLAVGWSSPPLGRFGVGLDLVSGTSLASGANAALGFEVVPWLHPFIGFSTSIDRRPALAPAESIFAGVSVTVFPHSP